MVDSGEQCRREEDLYKTLDKFSVEYRRQHRGGAWGILAGLVLSRVDRFLDAYEVTAEAIDHIARERDFK